MDKNFMTFSCFLNVYAFVLTLTKALVEPMNTKSEAYLTQHGLCAQVARLMCGMVSQPETPNAGKTLEQNKNISDLCHRTAVSATQIIYYHNLKNQ